MMIILSIGPDFRHNFPMSFGALAREKHRTEDAARDELPSASRQSEARPRSDLRPRMAGEHTPYEPRTYARGHAARPHASVGSLWSLRASVRAIDTCRVLSLRMNVQDVSIRLKAQLIVDCFSAFCRSSQLSVS
jgi:hypothetical protein